MSTNDNNTPPADPAQERTPAESAPAAAEPNDQSAAREPAPAEERAGSGARSREDLHEEPGDDIGNRMPAGLPAYAQRYFVPQAGRAHGPGPRPQEGRKGGRPGPKPPRDERRGLPRPPREGQGEAGEAAAPDTAAGEGAVDETTQAAVGEEGAPTTAEGAQAPAKKRRRRRRRKKGPLGAQAPGAAPTGEQAAGGAEGEEHEGEDEAEGEAHEGEAQEGAQAEGEAHEGEAQEGAQAEGEAHEGEAHEGEAQADGEEHEGEAQAEGEEPEGEEGEEPAEGEPGEGGKRPKKKRGHGPPAHHEHAPFRIGEEVFGRVHLLTEHAVWVDIAAKAMGLFDRRELTLDEPPVEGDQFIATVASTGVRGGMLMLSRQAADLDAARAKIEAAQKDGTLVEGFVTGAVKGGLEVDLGGLRAFAPASHVDLRHGADLGYLVGQRLDWEVTTYAKKGRDIVVSRRRQLEEHAKLARVEALKTLEPGSIHKGIVRKVVDWGVFVALPDAGGAEGLVHMTEASHDRGARLSSLFKQGETIDVKVLRVDERGKLWLSRKAAVADPWDAVKEKYAVGTRHKGTVARIQPFGAFIELEPGIDGLIHTADLSFKPIDDPNEVVKVGDAIDVVVAVCDSGAHRIGLHPAPPAGEEDEPRQRVVQYKNVKAVVAQIVEGGLVVRILGVTGRAARAFIPAGHTGTARGTDLRKEFPVGTRFDAKVLEVDPRRGEAKLSIRALKDDAEKQAYQQYRAGVQREAKFGTFADLMKKS
jgi:small subunit ribosomal protein S1